MVFYAQSTSTVISHTHRDRQTNKQTERDRQTETERETSGETDQRLTQTTDTCRVTSSPVSTIHFLMSVTNDEHA